MALPHVFSDSFGWYPLNQSELVWDNTYAIDNTVTGPFPGTFARQIVIFGKMEKTLPSSYGSLVQAVRFKLSASVTSSSPFFIFLDGTSTQVDLRFDGSGNLIATRNGTTIATTSFSPAAGTWYYLEFGVIIASGTSGSVTIKIDGGSTYNNTFTGLNTQATGNATASKIKFSGISSSTLTISDPITRAGSGALDFWGEKRIAFDFPTGDGATTNYTLSTGTNHYAVYDETSTNGDTDYGSSSTPGDVELLTFPSLSVSGTVSACKIINVARKDDAGSRVYAGQAYKSGTSYTQGNHTPNTTYSAGVDTMETDPSTGLPWANAAAVNAFQLGSTIVS